jgi:hypothetical protein
MKLLLTDAAGGEHDLDNVILGIAADIHRLNQRLINVEAELGITYQQAEAEAIADSEEENVGSK